MDFARHLGGRLAIAAIFCVIAFVALLILVPGFPPPA
jgi:hypothetical protein